MSPALREFQSHCGIKKNTNTGSSTCHPTTNAKEAKVERFYDNLQVFLKLTPNKDVLFILGDWNAKVGSQEISGVTHKFGPGVQNEAGQKLSVLPRECPSHRKHPLPTTEEMILHMAITIWSIPKSD